MISSDAGVIGGIAVVGQVRNACLGACLVLILAVAGCSGSADRDAVPQPGSTPPGSTQPGPTAASPSTPGAPGSAAKPSSPTTNAPTTKDQPVRKVQRSDSTSVPTVTAKPTSIDGKIEYGDGVSLSILDVEFGEETDEGPGAFPGREYAILTLKADNSSKAALTMQTVVVTVLANDGESVAPVYVAKAKVQDFSGVVAAGKSMKARYAFAVPKTSRSKVTVVVDFDGVHTSAVFRGKLT